MKTFLFAILIIAAAGCAQTMMQTQEERMQGECRAQNKAAVPAMNINHGIGYHCVDLSHDR